MVIPCMQAHLVTLLLHRTDYLARPFPDTGAGTKGALEEDVPAVKTRRTRAQHLDEEGWPKKAPDVPPHVVRPHGKKETPLNPCSCHGAEQPGNACKRASQRVHVDTQAYSYLFTAAALPSRRRSSDPG